MMSARFSGERGWGLATRQGGARPSNGAGDTLQDGVVVELFGPPGSGKTTLARAVAAELERLGIPVRLAVSARPEEDAAAPGPALVSRMGKIADAVSQMVRTDPVTEALMRSMPLTHPLAAMRRRRYLAGLAADGRTVGPVAGGGRGVLVQDQGYLCAIAGLALDSGRSDARALAEALELVPHATIAVRVGVPDSVAGTRLRERHSRQGVAARLLERDPADNARLETVFDRLQGLLEDRGSQILQVSGKDLTTLGAAVSSIATAVLAVGGAHPGEVAVP